MNRREALKSATVTAALSLTAPMAFSEENKEKRKKKGGDKFRFSLNTSTISGQKLGVPKYIDIAARAGYDCMELWIPDIKQYLNDGGTLPALKKLLTDSKIPVVNAIGFAPWMTDDDAIRKGGFAQMKQEMEIMAALDCPRIAAPSFGINHPTVLDMFKVGERFKQLIELGRQTGVMPQLEFWGASVFFHMGQAMMASAVANDPGARILADVYHLFRGNSGFESLKMVDGNMIEIFHMNDYPGTIAREKAEDKDRIYPGDGVAPIKQVLTDLKNMGGPKILSLELFNREYWAQDPFVVAKTGLEKMKKVAAGVI
jgi:sugar phosphate isomerase/epimerase